MTRFETETIDAELHAHRFAPLGSRTMAGKASFRVGERVWVHHDFRHPSKPPIWAAGFVGEIVVS